MKIITYTSEFKNDMIRLISNDKITIDEVSKRFNIPICIINDWIVCGITEFNYRIIKK